MVIVVWKDGDVVAEVDLIGDCDVSYWAANGYTIGERRVFH